eukprot:gnl/TRDRNA2_/TRDRNA2_139258_c1_seq1.p1 gnl/TRDRNA2_/TRDRNA2_139258_c1~~gnl/TRDRNA2_/TRDRNA2_139258_c1_seq1.p1  ORF type:complete len:232 (-),score=42.93 gnl/TRDRNA2_/TRDRNA2_139258_c1_seq1:84-755(-)
MYRTGIVGKGQLGRWGPNFAADPVITRWNRETGRYELAVIERSDSEAKRGTWALPGGMLEPGDSVAKTILKEFAEEALGELDIDTVGSKCLEEYEVTDCAFAAMIINCVEKSRVLYEGPVDDPRNTDNAWMETTALWVHCNSCELPESFPKEKLGSMTESDICDAARLSPATDAQNAKFIDVRGLDLEGESSFGGHTTLYASHGYMIRKMQSILVPLEESVAK